MRTLPICSLTLLLLLGCGDEEAPNDLRTSGTIEVTEVRLSAQTPGRLLALYVQEGDRVATGDTLGVVDHDLLRLQRRQAEAGVEAAAARLSLLDEGSRSEDVAQAEARVRQAAVERDRAEADAGRLRPLAEAGSVTQKQYDDAEARLAIARAAYDAADQALHKVRTIVRPAERRAAAAQLAQATATRDVLDRQIADAFLTAPLAGTILEQVAEPGELVMPGSAVLTVADLDRAFLRVYAPEADLGRLRLGQPAQVYTDAFPDRPLNGTVVHIADKAEFTPRNVQTREERVKLVYEVKVEVPNPDGLLKPGMYADAVLPLSPPPVR